MIEALKQQMAQEMLRVTKPKGTILWLDFFFSNPQNPDVRLIRLKEIRTLFPNYALALTNGSTL